MSTVSWSMSGLLANDGLVQRIRGLPRSCSEHNNRAANEAVHLPSSVNGWGALVNQLVEWDRDPHRFDGDVFEPPRRTVIQFACRLAELLRNEGLPSPARVVPNGEGGLVFECDNGPDLRP